MNWRKYWIVKVYGTIINHYLRLYDFKSVKTVDTWVANSKNVAKRIAKYYREKSVVVYPPVDLERFEEWAEKQKERLFLIVSRLVGAKGLEEAARVAKRVDVDLKL